MKLMTLSAAVLLATLPILAVPAHAEVEPPSEVPAYVPLTFNMSEFVATEPTASNVSDVLIYADELCRGWVLTHSIGNSEEAQQEVAAAIKALSGYQARSAYRRESMSLGILVTLSDRLNRQVQEMKVTSSCEALLGITTVAVPESGH